MIIHPEVFVTPDCPTIRFRESHENIDLDKELPKILHTQGWGCGTYFHVQFMNHEKTQLLSSCLYVVDSDKEELQINESNPYSPSTRTVHKCTASPAGKLITFNKKLNKKAVAEAKWNPDKKVHEVIVNGETIFDDLEKPVAEAKRDELNRGA